MSRAPLPGIKFQAQIALPELSAVDTRTMLRTAEGQSVAPAVFQVEIVNERAPAVGVGSA